MAVTIQTKYPLNLIPVSPVVVISKCCGEQGMTFWTSICPVSLGVVQTLTLGSRDFQYHQWRSVGSSPDELNFYLT